MKLIQILIKIDIEALLEKGLDSTDSELIFKRIVDSIPS